jgi:hypothetical protein
MHRTLTQLAALSLLAFVVVISSGQEITQPRPSTWVGFISDSKCGGKGAHADHKECAIRCVTRQGQSWIFVSSEYQVFGIENQNAVSKSSLGQEIVVTGRITDSGSILIESIRPRQSKPKE